MLCSIFVYACLGYVALLFGCHLWDCWEHPPVKAAPIATAAESPAPLLLPPALELPHPFEMSLERMPAIESIAAVHQSAAAVEPPAESLDVEGLLEAIDIPAPINYASLPSVELRRLCTDRGIRWRGVKAGKHLSKLEMISALIS